MRVSIAALCMPLALVGCLPGGFFTSKKSTTGGSPTITTIEADGLVTGRVDPSTGGILNASGNSDIAGSSVDFPAGALAIATDVTLEQGADILSDGVLTSLGVAGGDVDAAGNAILLESSVQQDALSPFSVAITVSGGAALLQSGELAILYKVIRNDQGGQLFVGFIPPSEITAIGDKLTFSTKYFGSYQAVRVRTDVTKIAPKPTTEPLIGRSDVGKLSAGQLATVFRNLKGGTKYFWKVEAIDANGLLVGASDTLEFTTK